jgi:ribosomal protein S18 acetylase RimI-like enzyme
MNIREWIYNDAHAIASVHVKSWQTTYRGIISDDYLDSLDISERTKRWGKNLSDPDQKVFVALEWENIVGFATCEKSEELEWYDSTLSSIYLLAEYQWKGIWSELFHACTSYLQSLGCRSMYIWVLADNPAKKFYEKMGGEYINEKEVLIGEEKYIEYAYSWIL